MQKIIILLIFVCAVIALAMSKQQATEPVRKKREFREIKPIEDRPAIYRL